MKSLKSLKSLGEGDLWIFCAAGEILCFFLTEAAEGGGGKRGTVFVLSSVLILEILSICRVLCYYENNEF